MNPPQTLKDDQKKQDECAPYIGDPAVYEQCTKFKEMNPKSKGQKKPKAQPSEPHQDPDEDTQLFKPQIAPLGSQGEQMP